MKVTLKAQIFLSGILEQTNKKICLVSVLAGGCSGMQYSMLFLDNLPDYDTTQISNGIYVDNLSLPLLQNCIIDLEEKIGSKRIIVTNSSAKSSCSCGSSFSI